MFWLIFYRRNGVRMRWLKNTPIAHVAQFLLAYARKASVRMPAVHGLYSIDKWEHEFYTQVLIVLTLILSRTFRQPANAIGGGCLFILRSTSFVRFLFFYFSQWSISAVVSVGILFVVFPACLWPGGSMDCHFPLIRSYLLPFPCPFSSTIFLPFSLFLSPIDLYLL